MAFLTITENVNASSGPGISPIGPLASLYLNKYQTNLYQYPRDLGSSYKGHAVKFQFLKITPSSLEQITKKIGTFAATAGAAVVGGAVAEIGRAHV